MHGEEEWKENANFTHTYVKKGILFTNLYKYILNTY